MASMAEINAKVAGLKQSQAYEKTFDFTRSFIAKANTAGEFAVPITNEGPFLQESYNIRCTSNSKVDYGGGSVDYCGVKLKFKSQADNAAMSNDFVPVQLIGTPGSVDGVRYGARPFMHIYPKGDVLIIEYDNRAPSPIAGETYTMADERVDICFNGKLYPMA